MYGDIHYARNPFSAAAYVVCDSEGAGIGDEDVAHVIDRDRRRIGQGHTAKNRLNHAGSRGSLNPR
jgi:hypothetical protein